MSPQSLRAEQVEATRQALIDAARALFATDGYGGVSTEQIVRAARVTRGALYHHFSDKQDLFAAVAGQVSAEINERVEAAALTAPTPWEGLLAGFNTFLDACLQPDTYRIVVLDGPSVLGVGSAEWRGTEDSAKPRDLLARGLEELMKTGVIERQPVGTLAHLLLGALYEAAMLIAVADDQEATRREVGAGLERLVRGLRID
jgi:AcrR family transcriptional regulator